VKMRITGCCFDKGKECASSGSEANKMEAKEHCLLFGNSDDDEEEQIEASEHEVTHVSAAQSTCKMHCCVFAPQRREIPHRYLQRLDLELCDRHAHVKHTVCSVCV